MNNINITLKQEAFLKLAFREIKYVYFFLIILSHKEIQSISTIDVLRNN